MKKELFGDNKNSKFEKNKIMGNIQLIRDSLIIGGFTLGIVKVALSWKSFWGSNEISRRKVGLERIESWTNKLTKKSSLARKIVESFDENQCKSLFNEDEIKVPDKLQKSLSLYFEKEINIDSNFCIIDEGQSSVLRWEIITYLNSLEQVLISWRHNIADKSLIEEQFSYLYDTTNNHTALERFRSVAGNLNYPSINEFITYLKSEKYKIKKGKNKVG